MSFFILDPEGSAFICDVPKKRKRGGGIPAWLLQLCLWCGPITSTHILLDIANDMTVTDNHEEEILSFIRGRSDRNEFREERGSEYLKNEIYQKNQFS